MKLSSRRMRSIYLTLPKDSRPSWEKRAMDYGVGMVARRCLVFFVTTGLIACLWGCPSSGPPSSSAAGQSESQATILSVAPSSSPPVEVFPALSAASAPVASAARPVAAPSNWIVEQLRTAKNPELLEWLSHASELRMQILVTVVVREEGKSPSFQEHGFRVDAEYIYPASASKVYLGVATLRTLRALAEKHKRTLPLSTRFIRCKAPAGRCEVPEVDEDPDPDDHDAEEKLSVKREVYKMLAYSDNESYSRLFDLVGHRALHELSYHSGFASVRFHHRMSSRARPRTSRRVVVLPWQGRALRLGERKSDLVLAATPAALLSVGQAHRGAKGLVEEPMSFAKKNYASLRDLHHVLRALVFPGSVPGVKLGLVDEDRQLLLRAMRGRRPPSRRLAGHKPLAPGVVEVTAWKSLRYVNKSGRAYGFHIDNAYIEDET
ncbi:MAG: serine hydrolase, partial [Polyangiaceae bacterium]